MKTQKLKKLKLESDYYLIDNYLKMKKIFLFFMVLSLTLLSCKKQIVEKPDNLIEEEVLVNIIYDLAILDAAKTQYTGIQYQYPKPTEYVKKKYKIDSVTFAKSTQYYASDVKNYKKIYERVKEKIDEEAKKIDGGKQLQSIPADVGIVK